MITTVIFDLDDTLYDEIDYCRSGFHAVSRVLARLSNLSCTADAFACLWKQFTAGNHTATFNAALDELGLACDDALIAQLVEVYRSHRPELTLPSESRLALDTLKKSYRLALLTDGYLPAQRLKVLALGLESDFEAIVYTEELGRTCWKPSPVGFETLIKQLNVTPETMAYVADNETKDFVAPNALGMLTIQLRRPARLHTGAAPRQGAAPRLRLDKIAELPTLLDRY
ncbi:MAG: HAD family hydrolase [Phycisphaerales bacterium]|nr:MAG: HAD family hydrolase [Phycisphaerales bacterium]